MIEIIKTENPDIVIERTIIDREINIVDGYNQIINKLVIEKEILDNYNSPYYFDDFTYLPEELINVIDEKISIINEKIINYECQI